jgi:hypothetical protein
MANKFDFKRARNADRDVSRVILPRMIARYLGAIAGHTVESMGFLYGVLDNDEVHVVTFMPHHQIFTPNSKRGAEFVYPSGKEGYEYVQKHNEIARNWGKRIDNFVSIGYHTHPSRRIEELTEEEKVILLERSRESYATPEEIFTNLPVCISSDDSLFSRRYCDQGLLVISGGRIEDPRNSKSGSKMAYLRHTLGSILGKVPLRLQAFQCYQGDLSVPVQVCIAEETDNYTDEERNRKVQKQLAPLARMVTREQFDYMKEVRRKNQSNALLMDWGMNALRKIFPKSVGDIIKQNIRDD